MDHEYAELLSSLKAVRDGEIAGTVEARGILDKARTAVAQAQKTYDELADLVEQAESAFIGGWPSRAA